jgi:nucleotide-binding universal stress UspA family protein
MDQHVLVPYDGSEPADTALDRALEENPEAEITVLHVIDASELTHAGGGVSAAESLDQAQREEAEELFEEAQDRADDYGATLTTAIETGQPGEVIVSYAEANDVDHIVMGSHGRSGLSGLLVGSVAETVIQNSPITVTIAR